MDFQNVNAAFQIRLVYDDPAIKTSRAQKRRVKDLRTVSRREYQKTFICVKPVHLRKELVQGLLTLIISAHYSVTGLSYGVDLVDKHNAGGLLLRLLKEIAHTGCAHANVHFHKRGARQGKERHLSLSCYSFRQQSFPGSRRSHKKGPLRQLRADPTVPARIVQEIHHFLKRLLRLILSCHILKRNSCLFLHIHLGITLSDAHHTAAF